MCARVATQAKPTLCESDNGVHITEHMHTHVLPHTHATGTPRLGLRGLDDPDYLIVETKCRLTKTGKVKIWQSLTKGQ